MIWLALAAKMAGAAALVVFAAWATERAGPLVGALVATLPVSAGPAYVFLALDHDSTFIAASALASLAANAATVVFCTVHALVAQSRGLAASLSAISAVWLAFALAKQSISWTLGTAILLNVVVFAICLPIGNKLRRKAMPPARRRWYDVPLRASMVAIVVGTVVAVSSRVGPTLTGILATFPTVLTSLVLTFQPRIGGPATAALTASSIVGLAGFSLALVVLHLAAVPLDSPAALTLALLVSVGWNVSILLTRSRKAADRDHFQGHRRVG